MEKQELINVFMESIEDKFPELIEEEKEKTGFSDGDQFYCISFDGKVNDDYWSDHQVDRERLSIGNAFKTEGEAKFAVEKLKVLHELEAFGSPFVSGYRNYHIVFDHYLKEVTIDYKTNRNPCFFNCFFNTEKEARQAINKIGEDRIKKYLFGVD